MAYRIPSSCAQLIEKSHQITGVDHITDTEIVPNLELLIDSLNNEAELSLEGSKGMEKRLLRMLCNRLRMLRDFEAHPEIEEQPIVRPLFMTGSPRSGSTKLHKMLASSGDFQHLPFWRGHNIALISGDRNEDPASRIKDAEEYTRWFNQRSPEAKLTHHYEAHEVEEENLFWEFTPNNIYINCMANVPSFIEAIWRGEVEMELLRSTKKALQYIQWQFEAEHPRRWLLKCPFYFGLEPELATVFPDADFVTTHRHSSKVIPSCASLVHCYQKVYSDVARKEILGPASLETQAGLAQQFVESRERNPHLPTMDVRYSELINSAESVVEKIYKHIDMPLSESARSMMQNWEKHNQQHKHGAHKYTLEEFSLSKQMIEESCREYLEKYQHCF